MFEKIRSVSGESARLSRFTTFMEDLSKQLTSDSKLLPRPDEMSEASGDWATQFETSSELLPGPAIESSDAEGGQSDESKQQTKPLETKQDEAVEVKVVESPITQIRNWVGPLVAPLSAAGLVAVLVLFMLLDREGQRNRLIQLFGTANVRATTEALSDAGRRVMRFLRMQFLINAGYGVCVAIALTVLGVPNAIMWGVLGFMLRFLPYIGPILAAVMPIVVSAAVSPGWTTPLLVVGWYVVLELVLNNVVEPWLYGSSIGVSAVGIIVSAIFWTWIWGPIGLVLAMPLTVCLVVLAQYVPQLRFVTVLLGDQPALSPAERTYQRFLALDETEITSLAKQHLKTATLADYYDDVLLPALYLCERDRHDGQLTDEQEQFVEETVQDLIDDLGARDESLAKSETAEDASAITQSLRVMCVPLRDWADEAAARMLAQLLRADGIAVEVGSVDSLTNEIVDEVGEQRAQLALISIMPPSSPRNSRLLYRRLRERYPKLPVLVGYWNAVQGEFLRDRFGLVSGDRLVISMRDALTEVRKAAAIVKPEVPGDAIGKRESTRPREEPVTTG
jgi:predicted PurR-regulated permease PerM